MRRLILSPALIALVACDTTLVPAQADANADADITLSSGTYVVPAHADLAAPPVIAPLRLRAVAVADAPTPAALRTATITLFEPTLGLVPGLVASLAAGDLLRPTNDLSLPAGVASLTGAPWLLHGGRIVLAESTAIAESWSAGVPTLITQPSVETDNDGLFVARRPLAIDALPSAMRALRGATVKVFDYEREVCVARIGGLGLEAQLVHHPDEYGEDGTVRRPHHDATAVFEIGGAMLLADLEPVIGTAADCAKGRWATPVASPTPTLFRVAAMDKSLSRLAVRAFRKTSAWSDAQHDFANFFSDEPGEARPKSRWDANAKHTFVRWLASDGSREVLAVHADTWDGCGSSGQKLTALFDVVRTGATPELRPIAAHAWDDVPAALLDREADGTLELMNDGVMFRWRDGANAGPDNDWIDGRYEELERTTVPDISEYGCGC